MRLFLCALIASTALGCSTSHHASTAASTTPIASTTTSLFECHGCNPPRIGRITGRYYTDGGPPPPIGRPPSSYPIPGTITVTNVESHQSFQPRQDSRGYFAIMVPVGTYGITAESHGGNFRAMTDTVTVTADKTVNADLGIHEP